MLALANIIDGRWDTFQPLFVPFQNGNETFMQDTLLNHLWDAFVELCDEVMSGTSEVPDLECKNLCELDG